MIGSKANVPFVRDVKDASNIEITGSWAFHYNSWKDGISAIPRIIIKYEDLLSNSEKIFTNLIKKHELRFYSSLECFITKRI